MRKSCAYLFYLTPVFLITLIFFGACANITRSDVAIVRNAAISSITNSFPRRFPVTIYRFTNTSTSTESAYLSRAIPDMIAGMLRPVNAESTRIDFMRFPVTMPESFKVIALASNTIFGDYITNVQSVQTQYTFKFITNSNYTRTVYATNTWDTNRFERIYVIQTNRISTNYTTTNISVIPEEQYVTIITNMFPEISNMLSLLPITIIRQSTQGFVATNFRQFSGAIYGSFSTTPSTRGPSTVSVNLTFVKFLESMDTNTRKFIYSTNISYLYNTNTGATNKITQVSVVTNFYSNRLTLKLQCREDELVSRVQEWLAPIRELMLAREVGDLQIVTSPVGVSVYLDGTFIGKTPLFYPSVPIGTHQISFMKNGYERLVLKAEVLPGMTNFLKTDILMKESGGSVTIAGEASNDLVFVDNSFRGSTPLTLTNLSIGELHRIQTLSSNTNYMPFYTTLRITEPGQTLFVSPIYKTYYGNPESIRRSAWVAAYGSWAVTLGFLGYTIYADYMEKYFTDLDNSYNNTTYDADVANWTSRGETFFTVGILSAFISAGLTANALYRDEIYLGIRVTPYGDARAEINIRY